MTRYAAHPTLYKGVMFRSRLEARYAAYFDGRGWQWVYEPFDLLGYSPDFTVWQPGDVNHLVEVKPATKLGQLAAPIARILRAGWKGPWMVVGADPDVCMTGVGRHQHKRRFLGQEAPEAWAAANNVTQWKGSALASIVAQGRVAPTTCPRCGRQDHPLHSRLCRL